MARLVAGGDSFVYGSELGDCFSIDPLTSKAIEQVSQFTYSALVAKKLNADYVCVARPGFSNNAIRRTVMNACVQDPAIDLALVTWSFTGRYEFRFNHDWEQISQWSITDDVEKKIRQSFQIDNPNVLQHHLDKLQKEKDLGISDFAKEFYSKVGSVKYWEIYNSLLEVVTLQQFFESRKISYLFTGVDTDIIKLSKNYSTDESISALLSLLDQTKWVWFPGDKGFYAWSKNNNYPYGTTHPLEPAHSDAADILYEHIRHLSWIS